MAETTVNYNEKLSLSEFNRLSGFIIKELGIKMPAEKRTMLQCRLQKRLRSLGIPSFGEYCDYLFSREGQSLELIHMIDAVTTNKTDFFREPSHFTYLAQEALPRLERRKLRVWSAGCSSGEEAYTLGIVLKEFAEKKPLDFEICGSDISSRMLKAAANAVYPEERIAPIPLELKKKYFLRSKDPGQKTVRVVKDIRATTAFHRINLIDQAYDIPGDFDIVFCRNVLIYFDRTTQEQVINKICRKLKPGGYFFLGHSESLMGMDAPLQQLKPTIFKKV